MFLNWLIEPFTMYAIAFLFLGVLFKGFIGAEAIDFVKLPPGAIDWAVGSIHDARQVVMHEGIKMVQVPFMEKLFCRLSFKEMDSIA